MEILGLVILKKWRFEAMFRAEEDKRVTAFNRGYEAGKLDVMGKTNNILSLMLESTLDEQRLIASMKRKKKKLPATSGQKPV